VVLADAVLPVVGCSRRVLKMKYLTATQHSIRHRGTDYYLVVQRLVRFEKVKPIFLAPKN
jgi:hypothetical protein